MKSCAKRAVPCIVSELMGEIRVKNKRDFLANKSSTGQRKNTHLGCLSMKIYKNSTDMVKFLSIDELLRADQYYIRQDMLDFVIRRESPRDILCYYTDIEPNLLIIHIDKNGKPYL